jgi:hypothetical protein
VPVGRESERKTRSPGCAVDYSSHAREPRVAVWQGHSIVGHRLIQSRDRGCASEKLGHGGGKLICLSALVFAASAARFASPFPLHPPPQTRDNFAPVNSDAIRDGAPLQKIYSLTSASAASARLSVLLVLVRRDPKQCRCGLVSARH